MLRSSMQAAVTMGQLQNKLDLIGNNLSNMNTPGYKSRQADFSSLLIQQMDNLDDEGENANRTTPDGIRIGSGAYLASTDLDMKQGSIKQTGRPLDVAIMNENHMFQVQRTENGQATTMYTRDGSFSFQPINENEVMLVTSNGNPVLGEDGPIRLQNNFESFTIRENGEIAVERNGETAVEARLNVVNASRPRLLEAAGQNLFRLPDLEELGYNQQEIIEAVGANDVRLQQGALESSNVDMGKQVTDMLSTQRAYQFNSRSIAMGDQMMGLINQLR
ncbi:flagellar hook-basal body protein [Pontibacillus marinus]|uniref:Flagellar hook-basal body protein n=1 Tax=Pontibacillus marinus BH030004 = DSM 16465 TaxID=1385511 RepID=A0A0A5GIL3_9BACI|nr:flagellar hook-basal body protein [Pontibacillus marinus]KGX90970.1 flagellar hook-basal body protein [Pontibacillus marinus BH030004 = DSM 16465]